MAKKRPFDVKYTPELQQERDQRDRPHNLPQIRHFQYKSIIFSVNSISFAHLPQGAGRVCAASVDDLQRAGVRIIKPPAEHRARRQIDRVGEQIRRVLGRRRGGLVRPEPALPAHGAGGDVSRRRVHGGSRSSGLPVHSGGCELHSSPRSSAIATPPPWRRGRERHALRSRAPRSPLASALTSSHPTAALPTHLQRLLRTAPLRSSVSEVQSCADLDDYSSPLLS